MEEFKALLSSPYTWLGFAISAAGGVWWSQLKPSTANFALGFAVLSFTVGIALLGFVAAQPLPIRLLFVMFAFSGASLLVYFTLWQKPPAPPDVPEVAILTMRGLRLADFPSGKISE